MTLPMGISVRLLAGFDDPALADDAWHGLLPQGPTDTLFLTPCWQRTWWQVFGRGQLLLVGIFQGDALVGLAPLFADGDMVFFVGSGGSDYLDFVGQIDGAGNSPSSWQAQPRRRAASPSFCPVGDVSGTW